jgi:uncharacterized RDD family membrane protein YckC
MTAATTTPRPTTATRPGANADPGASRVRAFVTPEGVDLRLRIADAAERAVGYVLDLVFINATLLVLFLAALGALSVFRNDAGEVAFVIWTLLSFLISNGYFIVMELTPRAATFGKRLMGTRVAARDGGRLTAEAIFIRNAMREIELALPFRMWLSAAIGGAGPALGWLFLLVLLWVGVFLFFPLFNRDRLRVGDFVAGTWVVKAPRERLNIDLLDAVQTTQSAFAFSAEQSGAYGVKELYVLEDVLRSKDAKTMAAVAERIRTKIVWRPTPEEADAAFLAAYYGALRARLETQLLFGRRRKDKYDVG